MAQTGILTGFSLDDLASEANKINREHSFAGNLFACISIAVFLLALFLLVTGSVPRTPSKLLELLGIPLLYGYIAFLYYSALKNSNDTDWTLAARINNEKEKMAKQVNLYRKLPTHFILPVAIIVLVGVFPDLFGERSGDISLTKLIFYIVSAAFVFIASIWGLKRAEKNKLRPLLKKLETLEKQLQDD